jgi:hypothetical protein
MTEPRTIAEKWKRDHRRAGRAWAAIRNQHADVPDVVIVTGAGANQKGTPAPWTGPANGSAAVSPMGGRGAAQGPQPGRKVPGADTLRGPGRDRAIAPRAYSGHGRSSVPRAATDGNGNGNDQRPRQRSATPEDTRTLHGDLGNARPENGRSEDHQSGSGPRSSSCH